LHDGDAAPNAFVALSGRSSQARLIAIIAIIAIRIERAAEFRARGSSASMGS
jgi:hypothetical protein